LFEKGFTEMVCRDSELTETSVELWNAAMMVRNVDAWAGRSDIVTYNIYRSGHSSKWSIKILLDKFIAGICPSFK
jgi:hypothetical protein